MMLLRTYMSSCIFGILSLVTALAIEIDENGYILFCPCMGRFGNQADHFLGALGFAKGLNRTLALPPWVEYRYGAPRSIQVPFDTYFEVEPLRKYHRVITMEEFMEKLAPKIWPPEKRTVFCYSQRGENVGCNAKEGNPFGPFWDTFGVDFVASQYYGPLHFDVYYHDMPKHWNTKFPPKIWPVMAFMGAPASFPVQKENRALHQYLFWNEKVLKKAKRFIKDVLPKGGFVGIHLRNGVDWDNACQHIKYSPKMFAAPQCVGYNNERGVATNEMCMPSTETVIRQLKRVIRGMKDVASVFVASDSNHMLPELRTALRRMEVEVHRLEPPNPHVELAILGLSNHFIANCISSYSSFAKRERDVRGYPSSFWAFPSERSRNASKGHDEL